MSLPQVLRKLPNWTLSTAEKMPLDLEIFYRTGDTHALYSPDLGSQLYPYDIVKKIQAENPNQGLRPAYRLKHQTGYLLVDIEPPALKIKRNPYLHLPFIYLEWSMHHGLHGLIPFNDEAFLNRVVIKDPTWQTEIIFADHFITFTNHELKLDINSNRNLAESPEFINNLTTHLHQISTKHTVEESFKEGDSPQTRLSELMNRPLTNHELLIVNNLDVPVYHQRPNEDRSHHEFVYLLKLANLLKKADPQIGQESLTDFVGPFRYLVALHLPFRKKHNEASNYSNVGYATYLERCVYLTAKIVLS